MILRPVDSNGDVLPVLSSGDLLRGAEAVAQLVRDRLTLFIGEWWENCSEIAGYIRGTPGVLDVVNIQVSVVGRKINMSCTVHTEYGTADINYEFG